MPKILRKTAIPFGASSGFQQSAQFGSLAAASIVYSTDPAVIQALSNWSEGWFAAILGGNSPAIEDMNSMCLVFGYQLAYIMQAGVPEWDAGTTYYTGSLVNSAGKIYVSLIDTNLNHAVTTADWSLLNQTLEVSINPSTQSPYTMGANDNGKTFLVNSSAAAMAFTLPAPAAGMSFTFKDSGNDASSNNITITQHGSEKIDGQNSYVISVNYGFVSLVSDGTNWFVFDRSSSPAVVMSVFLTSSTSSLGPNAVIIYDTVAVDNYAGYNVSTGEYTVPITGNYEISVVAWTSGGSNLSNNIQYLAIGGTAKLNLSALNLNASSASGTGILPLTAGQVLTLVSSVNGSTYAGGTAPILNLWSINQIE